MPIAPEGFAFPGKWGHMPHVAFVFFERSPKSPHFGGPSPNLRPPWEHWARRVFAFGSPGRAARPLGRLRISCATASVKPTGDGLPGGAEEREISRVQGKPGRHSEAVPAQPYRSSFRYRVLRSKPSTRAASALLPDIAASTRRTYRRSISAIATNSPG